MKQLLSKQNLNRTRRRHIRMLFNFSSASSAVVQVFSDLNVNILFMEFIEFSCVTIAAHDLHIFVITILMP